MNIPNEVKIGFKDYKVNKINNHVINDNMVCYGNIEHDNDNINISTLYSEDQQKCTFIHEVIHGIDNIFDIGLEEEQVIKLGKGIYQFIKHNSNIFKEGE